MFLVISSKYLNKIKTVSMIIFHRQSFYDCYYGFKRKKLILIWSSAMNRWSRQSAVFFNIHFTFSHFQKNSNKWTIIVKYIDEMWETTNLKLNLIWTILITLNGTSCTKCLFGFISKTRKKEKSSLKCLQNKAFPSFEFEITTSKEAAQKLIFDIYKKE